MKNKIILFGAAFLLVGFTVWLGIYLFKKGKKDKVAYKVERPFTTNIQEKTVASGMIKPRREIHIKPQISGVVEEIFVKPGDIVKKGQPIAQIDLVPDQVNINNAQNSVKLARLQYQNAQRELEKQRNITRHQLDVENTRVNYENAKVEAERHRQLFEQGVISEQILQQKELAETVARVDYENAKLLSTNNLRQFEADVNIRKQELNSAINNLQLLQEGYSSNSRQVANMVTSTVDGMILELPVEAGASVIERNTFNEGTTVALIADMNELIFEGKVDESDVSKLQEGMALELTVGAIKGHIFHAVLEHIAPKGSIDNGSMKFAIQAAIQPTSEVFLRAGYSASADIILQKRETVLAVKERDILFVQDSTFVEVKQKEGYSKVPVKVGLSDGINIEIEEGVDSTSLIKVQKII